MQKIANSRPLQSVASFIRAIDRIGKFDNGRPSNIKLQAFLFLAFFKNIFKVFYSVFTFPLLSVIFFVVFTFVFSFLQR